MTENEALRRWIRLLWQIRESAILAIGRCRDMPVVESGQVVVRPVSKLTITVDHRLSDGKAAAEFLNTLAGLIEGRPQSIFPAMKE